MLRRRLRFAVPAAWRCPSFSDSYRTRRWTPPRSAVGGFNQMSDVGYGAVDDLRFDFRRVLFPEKVEASDSSDPLYRLTYANAAKEVLDVFEALGPDGANREHVLQTANTLHHLQNRVSMSMNDHHLDHYKRLVAIQEFNCFLNGSANFHRLLEMVKFHTVSLSTDDRAKLFYDLHWLGVPLHSRAMQDLTVSLKRELGTMGLVSMNYISASFSKGQLLQESNMRVRTLFWFLTLAPGMDNFLRHVSNVRSVEEVGQVATMMSCVPALISNECMETFASKVTGLMDKGHFRTLPGRSAKDESLKTSILVKVLKLYLLPNESFRSRERFTFKLLLQLQGRTCSLRPWQLLILSKVTNHSMGHASVGREVNAAIRQSLQAKTLNNPTLKSFLLKGHFLHCLAVQRLKNVDFPKWSGFVEETIKGPMFPCYAGLLFDLIRSTSIGSDADLVRSYFARVFDECGFGRRNERLDLTTIAWRYFRMHSVTNGRIRDESFEKNTIDEFEKSLVDCCYPVVFAVRLSFVIGHADAIPGSAVDKFRAVCDQFNPFSVYVLSRGLEERHRLRSGCSKQKPDDDDDDEKPTFDEETEENIAAIDAYLSDRIETLVDRLDDDAVGTGRGVEDVLFLLRSLVCRQKYVGKQDAAVVGNIVRHVERAPLTFATIRSVSNSLGVLSAAGTSFKTVSEKFLDHALEHGSHVHVRGLSDALHLLHRTNHDLSCAKGREFLDVCSGHLLRDFESLDGLQVLELAWTLVECGNFPARLANRVFSPDFLDILDREIANCSPGYGARLQMTLMQLNRAVFILHPQLKVPWFHEAFCRERINALRPKWNASSRTVLEEAFDALSDVVGGCGNVREAGFSPYYFHIPLEVWKHRTDNSFAPIDGQDEFSSTTASINRPENEYQKFVVLLDCGASGVRTGFVAKQLQTLGYSVISVNESAWSKMSTTAAMREFFASRLEPVEQSNKFLSFAT